VSRTRRVLIVDDHRGTAEIIALAVSRDGHEISVAHDAASAIRIATAFKPDVAFLDIGLPGIDGFDLALALRATPELKECRLIAVTGYILPPHRAARPRVERRQRSGLSGNQRLPRLVNDRLRRRPLYGIANGRRYIDEGDDHGSAR
jgi:CheY-like chemotaxis protein